MGAEAVAGRAAAEALEVLGRLVADLGSAKKEVALEQRERGNRLVELTNLLLQNPSQPAVAQLLRGAEAAAEALAVFDPTLPAGGSGPSVPHLSLALQHLVAACSASALLLSALALTNGQLPVSSAAAYRLAGCAGLALVHGPAAVQAAQQHVAGARPAAQRQLAHQLVMACHLGLMSLGRSAHLMVLALGDQQPGPALQATTCKRERLLALCLACAPVLVQWQDQLGPDALDLSALPGLAAPLAPFNEGELAGEGGAALAALLPVQYTALSRRVCSLNSAQLAAASSRQLIDDWQMLGHALISLELEGRLSPARDALTASVAASMARLLPAFGSSVQWRPQLLSAMVTLAFLSLILLEGRMKAAAAAAALPAPRRGGSAGVPAALLPEVCLEGLALNASAFSALAAAHALAGAHAQGAAGAAAAAEVMKPFAQYCTVMARVLQHAYGSLGEQVTGRGSQGGSMLPPGSFPAVAAAAEAYLQLCGRLMQLSVQLVALAGEQAALGDALEHVCCAANTTAVIQVTAAARDMTAACPSVGAHTVAAFGRLCATAAKLGLLLASQLQLPTWETDDRGLSLLLCAGHLVLASLRRLAPTDASLPGWTPVARYVEGALLALVSAMRALTTGRHAAPGADATTTLILGNVTKLLGVLLGLEQQLPWAAGSLRLELAHLVCGEWKAAMDLWGGGGGEPVVRLLTEAASFVKTRVDQGDPPPAVWRRRLAACILVRQGFLDTAMAGALRALGGDRAQGTQAALALQQLWVLVEGLGGAVLAEAGDAADPAAASAWQQGCHAVRQLPPACQRHRLCSRSFWDREVAGSLLPALERLAAAIEAPAAGEQQEEKAGALLRAAQAHAAGACAHPGCTNLRGASEGRLRGRRCGACGAVRYCSQECARADWPQHGQVCGVLRQEAAAAAALVF